MVIEPPHNNILDSLLDLQTSYYESTTHNGPAIENVIQTSYKIELHQVKLNAANNKQYIITFRLHCFKQLTKI